MVLRSRRQVLEQEYIAHKHSRRSKSNREYVMRIVMQHPYSNACQQACIAMLAGVELQEVIRIVGEGRLGVGDKLDTCKHFGIVLSEYKIVLQTFATREYGMTLTEIRKQYAGCPLWISQYDCMDTSYGHAVLLHHDTLYDPFYGVNPQHLWSRRLTDVCPVLSSPVN